MKMRNVSPEEIATYPEHIYENPASYWNDVFIDGEYICFLQTGKQHINVFNFSDRNWQNATSSDTKIVDPLVLQAARMWGKRPIDGLSLADFLNITLGLED